MTHDLINMRTVWRYYK